MTSTAVSTLLNREVSLLKFNRRVLSMAYKPEVPLLERLRFLCIVSSNLDEFFEIRVASLKQQEQQAPFSLGVDGLTAHEAFSLVEHEVRTLIADQYDLLNQTILPALEENGIHFYRTFNYTPKIRDWAHHYFLESVMPLLTPIGLDPSHPFPRVYNKSLNFIVSLQGTDDYGRQSKIAVVQAPRTLPRLIKVPEEVCESPFGYTMLSSLMQAFMNELFLGLNVNGVYQWRVTRNSDLFVDEDELTDLRQALQGELSQRNFGAAVRLEIANDTPVELEHFLQKEFSLTPADTYRTNGPVNLARLMALCDIPAPEAFFFPKFQAKLKAPFNQVVGQPQAFFSLIAKEDQLLHHPYQSFAPVIQFLNAAASDPQVLGIKQTIYRTGEDSEMMEILVRAAQAGKAVTVVVELMARFDEQTNINWAARLEEVGAHVIYGVVGHKTHAKMALVIRKEGNRIVRYGHLGTGNYHSKTAKLYTDFGLITADPDITEDMNHIFTLLTGLGIRHSLKKLLQSPFTMHSKMMDLIRFETNQAKLGKPAKIMAKMNSLLEPQVIEALYEASQAGVQIDLIVRGVCALRAGVKGLSETIRVRSIVGRFLEHSRIYYFYHQGQEKLYLSSADWMGRNFFRRVEVAFPIENPALKQRVMTEGLTMALRDNELAWEEEGDGNYHRVPANGQEPFNLQLALIERLK